MEQTKTEWNEALINCGNCGSERFELRLTIVDGVKSIIAHCKYCGKTVEYRGIQEAITLIKGKNTTKVN